MKSRFLLWWALLGVLLPAAPHAQDAQSPLLLPGQREDTWIIQGLKTPDDWQFIMGPKGSPDMALKLIKATPKGTIGFLCRASDGSRRVGVTFPGLMAEKNAKFPVVFTIAGLSGTLTMTATDKTPSGDITLESDDFHTSQLLSGMAKAAGGEMPGTFTIDASGGHVLTAYVPDPADVSTTAVRICDAWNQKAVSVREHDGSRVESLGTPVR